MKLSFPQFRLCLGTLVLFVSFVLARAQNLALPLENKQDLTRYNLQSIATNYPWPPGWVTTTNSSIGGINRPPTTNQFRSLASFAGILAKTNWQSAAHSPVLQGTNAFSADVAANMQLPRFKYTDGSSIVLRRASVGSPYFSRQVSFQFGAVITPPITDENGVIPPGGLSPGYWLPQPYFYTNDFGVSDGFYWSPNALTAFAIRAGPISVTWQRSLPTTNPNYVNVNGPTGGPSYVTNGGSLYQLYTSRYVVSSSTVKPPQKIYWTEPPFDKIGHLVSVPSGSVGALNIVYYRDFPQYAPTNYQDPYTVPQVTVATNTLQEPRTLWYANNAIHAYNIEGRVFVEVLGEFQLNGSRRFLGFEIVDVFKEPVPNDITVDLGERMPAFADLSDDSYLYPSPALLSDSKFYYSQSGAPGQPNTLYATAETHNLNDFESHWLIPGVAGIQWPYVFNRYREVWPSDAARYVHYLRPVVGSEAEALRTAVVLPGAEAPKIDDQDALQPPYGAKIVNGSFYTFLNSNFPAHRSLLQFSSGDQVSFERVLSWLDVGIVTNGMALAAGATNNAGNFQNSVAVFLTNNWNPKTLTLNFNPGLTVPYFVSGTVHVGERIPPPDGELGSSGSYWAGYILRTNGNAFKGTSFNPGAYLDPFVVGFDRANQGAIIPVNAIPGQNQLEIWWFRRDQPDTGRGFLPSYWPTVVGRYQIQWPTPNGDNEIILASNRGSGPLTSLPAKGSIYRQNDPGQPGYNPNEEHALLLGGQAYALRDDLNLTNAGPDFTSQPYVLLDYTESDGRPAMRVWHVRREDPANGILFDYIVSAAKLLQGPMPLPLLEPPVPAGSPFATNYNVEPPLTSGDLPVGWNSPAPDSIYGHYGQFTFEDRKHEFWVYRGPHAGPPALTAGSFVNGSFTSLPMATAVLNQPFTNYVHTSRRGRWLTPSASGLPPGLNFRVTSDSLVVSGIPTSSGVYSSIPLIIQDGGDDSQVTNFLTIQVVSQGSVIAQGPLTITSTNQYSASLVNYTGRPPSMAAPPTPTNSFTMRFYYKTQSSFDWPTNTPPVGSIVPYLLPWSRYGIDNVTSSNTPSLNIVYRPEWPSLTDAGQPLPRLSSGETLTVPRNGAAEVRGQSSVNLLYQQSIGLDFVNQPTSVRLFDPEVQKVSNLADAGLSVLPPSIVSQSYLGNVYFPNLPPHLKNRFWFDPNAAQLVYTGQFVDEPVGGGHEYLLLNVLRGSDLDAVNNLCSNNDPARPSWEAAVANLSVNVYTKALDTNGNYSLDTDLTVTRGVGDLVEITNANSQVVSYAMAAGGPGVGYVTYIVGNGLSPQHAGEPVSMYVLRTRPQLYPGEVKVIQDSNPLSEVVTLMHTADLAGLTSDYSYDWYYQPPVDGQPPLDGTKPSWQSLARGTDLAHVTFASSAGIKALADNYVTLRYKSINPQARPESQNWSDWTPPVLVEGWIKRVLAGINPFNQRTTDLFNNPVNTTGSIISQAGHRWEGDVALNLDTLNQRGLIEIYETVLNRGKALSITAAVPIDYGPANDALLLAAGYLSDLYTLIGNDAWADAANPTIGIGTANKTYGNIATALFAFKGEEPSLLEEELALLRGRDDFLTPGVRYGPVYNRLFWNYTRGINAGEVVYALNYNILDQNNDGVVNAADAAILYPQGHGDAYGHFLTALTGYYSLLMNPNFDWVPRIEAVTVLGAAVSVGYQDERKFASAAAALARTGRQVFDLTWREGYLPGTSAGWHRFDTTTPNSSDAYIGNGKTNPVTRAWGLDHWATRVGQGAYIHWLVGNAIVPFIDPDPSHQGIQKVDRTTIPELMELPTVNQQIQNDMDNAEAGFTPLGLSQNSIPFDINPQEVTGANPKTHFEQIYERAVGTLDNAVIAFDDAQNVTQLMRSEEDSLNGYQVAYNSQEIAYQNQLIDLYGTPYPEDIGPGQTYQQGYVGPDLIHYTYVATPDTNFSNVIPNNQAGQTFRVDVQNISSNWYTTIITNLDGLGINPSTSPAWSNDSTLSVPFYVGPDGFFDKPPTWTTDRQSPGKIQQAISELIAARNQLRKAVVFETYDKQTLDKAMMAYQSDLAAQSDAVALGGANSELQKQVNDIQEAYNVENKLATGIEAGLNLAESFVTAAVPNTFIFGLAVGGDEAKVANVPLFVGLNNGLASLYAIDAGAYIGASAATTALQNQILDNTKSIANSGLQQFIKDSLVTLGNQELNLQNDLFTINEALRSLDDKQRAFQTLVAQGNRIQQERLTFRQHAAAVIQGYRTRDAAFRIFQNEKLERYKTLFDLAAKYAFLAAQAFDYETGLLNTDQGHSFLNRIISARALGVVIGGQPQYAGSDTGDPGLSSALAEMKADWDVLKGRLGFNNPDGYGTIASLRTENFRILPDSLGDDNWQTVLQRGRTADLRADSDVARYCLQIDAGDGQPVPGIIITFATTISDGRNLFGQPLGPTDHSFSPSSFATKIFATGVDFDGYIGMDNPANSGGGAGSTNPSQDPNALAATPYVYLIPVGADSMRSPPLGDAGTIRSWNVDDLAIPLPFNIGGSDYSSLPFYTSANSLTEPLFGLRKHQAFRPVSTTDAFNSSAVGSSGNLQSSQYTNRRLIGRSVWNSQWKLVIPGKTLLSDPNEGLDRFIRSVKDIKLYFVTYSYSGN